MPGVRWGMSDGFGGIGCPGAWLSDPGAGCEKL